MTRETNGLVGLRMVRHDGAIVEVICPECSGRHVQTVGTIVVSATGIEADELQCSACGYAWQPGKVEMK